MVNSLLSEAHHEAGHALVTYHVRYIVDLIELKLDEKNEFEYGIVRYFSGVMGAATVDDLKRRILCALGGPVAQMIFENRKEPDLYRPEFIRDAEVIDSILMGPRKQELLNDAIERVSTFLRLSSTLAARESLVSELLLTNKLSHEKFIEIVQYHQVPTIQTI